MKMNRQVGYWARVAAGEDGIALITVIIITFCVSLLAAVMLKNLSGELSGVRRQKEVTTGLDAADAGVDQLTFDLQQGTAWTTFVTSYSTGGGVWWGNYTYPPGSTNYGWWLIGSGRYRAHIDYVDPSNPNVNPDDRMVTVQGQFPVGTGPIKSILADLHRQAPAALTFAIFADTGFDEHHHNSSWVSPTVVTTKIHSNGYAYLDWSSSFHVDSIEAATTIEIAKGGGTTPGGSIPSNGYAWPYWISGSDTQNSARCYPPKVFPPKTIANSDPSFSTYWNAPSGSTCPAGQKLYSPNAQVLGDVYANKVIVDPHGDTVKSVSGTTCISTQQPGYIDPITGACIPDRPGDIHGGVVTVGGHVWTGVSVGNTVSIHYRSGTTPPPCSGANCVADCSQCNQGTNDQAGDVGGSINLHPASWTPGSIPFPSLNYRSVWYPKAQADQGGAVACANGTKTCHIFPTSDGKDILTYLANKSNVTGGYSSSSCMTCVFWLDAAKHDTTDPTKAAYVIARGTYFITGATALNLNWTSIRTLFGTPATAATPVLMFAGALILEKGNLTQQSNLTVVGPTMDPFSPLAQYAATTVPGLLAAGGSMSGSDFDTDSNWTSTSQYEGLKRGATTVRGLVYSAYWNATTGTSVSTDQHWHNYDPKNSTTIIGAQVGGKLHDCNSFIFAYDPLVGNLPGFTSGGNGGVYVLSWQEL